MTDKRITLDDFTHPVPVGATIPKGTLYGVGNKEVARPQHFAIASADRTPTAESILAYYTATPIPAPMTRRENLAEVLLNAYRCNYEQAPKPFGDVPSSTRAVWLTCADAALAFLDAEEALR